MQKPTSFVDISVSLTEVLINNLKAYQQQVFLPGEINSSDATWSNNRTNKAYKNVDASINACVTC